MPLLSASFNSLTTAAIVCSYFLVLLIIARLTTKKNDNQTFFTANRNSPWYLVAFGMIGTSISGITFISIPGDVGAFIKGTTQFNAFYYFQIVIGYFFGYLVIIKVLLPLYYRLNLTSIYTYLEGRYGPRSYATGAFFFLLSRSLGSALRLMVAATVFQIFIFDDLGVPFWLTVSISMLLILLYSIRGGIKTIIWTDTLQTFFLVLALILTIIFLNNRLGYDIFSSAKTITHSPFSKIFSWDYKDNYFFVKQFLAGMFITVTMTGLDQDLMQKNLTCRSLKEAQKNMFVFSWVLVFVNLLFLSLGALLYIFLTKSNIDLRAAPDQVFPTVAKIFFPLGFKIVFLIGLTAATFASTDSALTALTTSFCVDFLGFNKAGKEHKVSTRYKVHIGFALLIILLVCLLHLNSDESVIHKLFEYSAYTYGPLLGLFAFGLASRRRVPDLYIPFICILSPFATYGLAQLSGQIFPDYKIGFETIVINGLIVYLSLHLLGRSPQEIQKK
jgi:Na+/proline symporter